MKKSAETEMRIVAAAWKAFREHGLARLEMKEVAHNAGVGRTTLYRYYSDKEQLALRMVEGVFARYAERMERWLTSEPEHGSGTALERIRRLMEAWVAAGTLSTDDRFIAEFDAYAAKERVSDEFADSLRRITSFAHEEEIIALLRRGVQEGSIRDDIDPHLLYVTVLNTLRALRNRLVLRGEHLFETTPEEREATAGVLLQLLIDGIKGDRYGT